MHRNVFVVELAPTTKLTMSHSTVLSALFFTVLCSAKAQQYYNTSANAYGCVCIPYQQCPQDYGINRKFITCATPGNVCCVPPTVPTSEKTQFKRHSMDGGCGRRYVYTAHVDPTDELAEIAEFPWMVSILKKTEPDQQGQVYTVPGCGGSLIHAMAVLTAAHCVNEWTANRLVVRAGDWNLDRRTEPLPFQDRDVQEIIIHENFDRRYHSNDAAILILASPFDLQVHINVVCLPDITDLTKPSCVAAGWGEVASNPKYEGERILKKIELPPFDRGACANLYHRVDHNFILGGSHTCYGGERGKDTCKGDSGTPLVCRFANDRTRYAQMGIAIRGSTMCGVPGFPGLYTSVKNIATWIDDKMILHGLGTNTYKYKG